MHRNCGGAFALETKVTTVCLGRRASGQSPPCSLAYCNADFPEDHVMRQTEEPTLRSPLGARVIGGPGRHFIGAVSAPLSPAVAHRPSVAAARVRAPARA